jgi:hypothetical protein
LVQLGLLEALQLKLAIAFVGTFAIVLSLKESVMVVGGQQLVLLLEATLGIQHSYRVIRTE